MGVTQLAVAFFIFVPLIVLAAKKDPGFSECRDGSCARDVRGRTLLQHYSDSFESAVKQVPSSVAPDGDQHRVAMLQQFANWTSPSAVGGPSRQHEAHRRLLGLAQVDDSVGEALSRVMTLSNEAEVQTPSEPLGIAKWIKHQMLPQVNLSKLDMQRQVTRAVASVESCSSVLDATDENGIRQGVSLRSRELRLVECNEDANKLKEAKEKACQELQTFSEGLEAPMCLDRIFRHAEDLLEENLRRNWEFFNEKYPAFVKRKKVCDDATLASETKFSQCQRDKSLIEATFCELRSARRSACSEYSTCYSSMSASFRKVIKDVKSLNLKTKDEYRAIRRIECFIGIMVDGKADSDEDSTNPGSCDWQNLDVSSLNVTYPALPAKRDCEEEVQTKIDYSEVECPAEVGTGNDGPEEEVSAEAQVPLEDQPAMVEQQSDKSSDRYMPKARRKHRSSKNAKKVADASDGMLEKMGAVAGLEEEDFAE